MLRTGLGLGILLVWMPLFCNWTVPLSAPVLFVGTYRVLFSGGLAVCFALLFFLRSKLLFLFDKRLVLALSCLLASIATLTATLAANAVLPPVCFYCSALVASLCAAFMITALILTPKLALERLVLEDLLIPLGAAAVFAALMAVIYLFAPQATAIIVIPLPLAFFVCLPNFTAPDKKANDRDRNISSGTSSAEPYRWHYKKNITVSTVITGLCLGIAFQEQFSFPSTTTTGFAFAAGVGFALLLIVAILKFLSPTINSFAAARMPLPYLCGYILLLPFVDKTYQAVMVFGIVCIWTLSLIFRLDIAEQVSNQYAIDRHTTYGEMLTFRFIGIFAGIVLSYIFQRIGTPLHPYAVLVVAFISASAISFLLTDKQSLPVWQTHHKNDDSVLEKSVLFVASEGNLTSRETDILFLLARGHNAQHIADELVISFYTAKTHIKRLYKKLNVHSQQDLLSKIEDVAYLSLSMTSSKESPRQSSKQISKQ